MAVCGRRPRFALMPGVTLLGKVPRAIRGGLRAADRVLTGTLAGESRVVLTEHAASADCFASLCVALA